ELHGPDPQLHRRKRVCAPGRGRSGSLDQGAGSHAHGDDSSDVAVLGRWRPAGGFLRAGEHHRNHRGDHLAGCVPDLPVTGSRLVLAPCDDGGGRLFDAGFRSAVRESAHGMAPDAAGRLPSSDGCSSRRRCSAGRGQPADEGAEQGALGPAFRPLRPAGSGARAVTAHPGGEPAAAHRSAGSAARWSDPPVVVITGGSSGIGRAVGEHLARDGYRVISLARRHPDSYEGWAAASYDVDVTDADRLAEVAAQVQHTHGHIDALVTSAGAVQRGDLLTTAQDDLFAQVEVNLLGTMAACRAFGPALQVSRGAVVTVSSSIATNPQASAAAYAAAKGGVESFSRALALEWAPVRVNVVRPSLVDTGIWMSGGMS